MQHYAGVQFVVLFALEWQNVLLLPFSEYYPVVLWFCALSELNITLNNITRVESPVLDSVIGRWIGCWPTSSIFAYHVVPMSLLFKLVKSISVLCCSFCMTDTNTDPIVIWGNNLDREMFCLIEFTILQSFIHQATTIRIIRTWNSHDFTIGNLNLWMFCILIKEVIIFWNLG